MRLRHSGPKPNPPPVPPHDHSGKRDRIQPDVQKATAGRSSPSGSASFGSVVTIDLERERELHSVFDQSDPWKLLQELAVLKNQRLVPGLHVIAAGSLLDFALRDFARDWNYDLQIDA